MAAITSMAATVSNRGLFAAHQRAIIIDTTIGKVLGGEAQGDTLVNIERIVASAHDDSIGMEGGDNTIWAGNGHDEVDGGSGIDTPLWRMGQ